jgi:hypothetical protein
MEEQIKLCKDCKHFSRRFAVTDKCTRVGSDDNINGEPMSCISARWAGYGECLPEGLLFEQNTFFWYKLKNFFK